MPTTSLDWLFSLERFGMKLGLDAVRRLLAALDRPERGLPAVLVAGTNGKGSTAAMTAAILSAAGVRTLLYTSPHVASVRERIMIDGRRIPAAVLGRHLTAIRHAIRALRRRDLLPQHPTFFEVLTAAALLHARHRRAQAGVFEIGLGGRYDATNVVPASVAVITSIERDHELQLGRSLARIAWNKAGIIHDGATVLTAETHPGVWRVIRESASRKGARLRHVSRAAAHRRAGGSWDLRLGSGRWAAGLALPRRLPAVRLGLTGPDQGQNAVLAAGAAAALARSLDGVRLTSRAIRAGLATARLPGRHEWRHARGNRLVLLDAAHNAAASRALAGAVRREVGDRPLTVLFGVMQDKDAGGMARALFPLAGQVVLCRPRHRRARGPRSLRALVPDGVATRVIADPGDAFTDALTSTPAGGVVLVTGSFYLLGDLAARTARLPHGAPLTPARSSTRRGGPGR